MVSFTAAGAAAIATATNAAAAVAAAAATAAPAVSFTATGLKSIEKVGSFTATFPSGSAKRPNPRKTQQKPCLCPDSSLAFFPGLSLPCIYHFSNLALSPAPTLPCLGP